MNGWDGDANHMLDREDIQVCHTMVGVLVGWLAGWLVVVFAGIGMTISEPAISASSMPNRSVAEVLLLQMVLGERRNRSHDGGDGEI